MTARTCRGLIPALLAVSITLSGCALGIPAALDSQDDESAPPTKQASTASQRNDAPEQGDCFQLQKETGREFRLSSQVQKVPCSREHALEVYAPPFYEADGKDDYVDRCPDVADYGGANLSQQEVSWVKRLVNSAIVGKTERNGTVPISCTWGLVRNVATEPVQYEEMTGTLRGILVAPDGIERVGACVVVTKSSYDPATMGGCREGEGTWLLSQVFFRDSAGSFPGEEAHERATPRCQTFLSPMVPRGARFAFLVAPPTKTQWDAGERFAACLIAYDDISEWREKRS